MKRQITSTTLALLVLTFTQGKASESPHKGKIAAYSLGTLASIYKLYSLPKNNYRDLYDCSNFLYNAYLCSKRITQEAKRDAHVNQLIHNIAQHTTHLPSIPNPFGTYSSTVRKCVFYPIAVINGFCCLAFSAGIFNMAATHPKIAAKSAHDAWVYGWNALQALKAASNNEIM